jgi:hypothetical protein
VLVGSGIFFVPNRVAVGVTTLGVVSTAVSRGCHCSIDMILSALGHARTVLILGLPLKGLIPFRESIFHINTSYNPYPGNVGRHN